MKSINVVPLHPNDPAGPWLDTFELHTSWLSSLYIFLLPSAKQTYAEAIMNDAVRRGARWVKVHHVGWNCWQLECVIPYR